MSCEVKKWAGSNQEFISEVVNQSIYKTAEEIMAEHESMPHDPFEDPKWIIEAIKAFGRQERDKALDWAAENWNVSIQLDPYYGEGLQQEDLDTINQTILSGKTHPDLHI